MTESFSDRIMGILQLTGFRKYQFAEKIGVSKTFMSDVSLGKQKPSGTMLIGIAEEFPQIDMNWLLAGRGSITHKHPAVLEDLAIVIKTVEIALNTAKISPSPEKRAQLITAAYDLYIHSNKPSDTTPILRLITTSVAS